MGVFGLDLRHGPTWNGALWYVRALLMFVLCAPAFKWLVTCFGRGWLVAVFALNLVNVSGRVFPDDIHGLLMLGFPLSGVFYFSLGIYIERFAVSVRSHRLLGISLVAGIGLLTLQALVSVGRSPSQVCQTLAIPFLLYALWHLTPQAPWPDWLTRCSFPIFLMHTPLIPYFFNPLKHTLLAGTAAASWLTYACVVASSVAFALMLKRLLPRLAAFLFAGRG